jgi:hypothetical protein
MRWAACFPFMFRKLAGEDYALGAAYLTETALAALTLTASAGSFVFSGSAAGVLTGRAFAAAAGGFALSGAAVSLRVGHAFAAGAGSFALSGAAAGVLTGRAFAAGVGTYTLTGGSAGLLGGFRVIAESGPFTVTGGAASLRPSLTFIAEGSSFSFTGGAVGFTVEQPPISVVITGGSGRRVITTRHYKLIADGSEFASRGGNADLFVDRYLKTEPGVFGLAVGEAEITLQLFDTVRHDNDFLLLAA